MMMIKDWQTNEGKIHSIRSQSLTYITIMLVNKPFMQSSEVPSLHHHRNVKRWVDEQRGKHSTRSPFLTYNTVGPIVQIPFGPSAILHHDKKGTKVFTIVSPLDEFFNTACVKS